MRSAPRHRDSRPCRPCLLPAHSWRTAQFSRHCRSFPERRSALQRHRRCNSRMSRPPESGRPRGCAGPTATAWLARRESGFPSSVTHKSAPPKQGLELSGIGVGNIAFVALGRPGTGSCRSQFLGIDNHDPEYLDHPDNLQGWSVRPRNLAPFWHRPPRVRRKRVPINSPHAVAIAYLVNVTGAADKYSLQSRKSRGTFFVGLFQRFNFPGRATRTALFDVGFHD